MVEEDHGAVRFADDGREFAERLTHETRLESHLSVSHFSFDFSTRGEGSDGVDDHNVYRVGTNERFNDFETLLTRVGLGEEQIVNVHSDAFGVSRIECVFGVNKGGLASALLNFSNHVKGERGFTGTFWTVDFDHTAFWNSTAERQIERNGAGWNGFNIHVFGFSQFHDGPRSETLFNLGKSEFEGFFAVVCDRGFCFVF